MTDKKAEAKEKALNVEITAGGAHGKDGAHNVGDKLKFDNGVVPRYLLGKCKILVNGKA